MKSYRRFCVIAGAVAILTFPQAAYSGKPIRRAGHWMTTSVDLPIPSSPAPAAAPGLVAPPVCPSPVAPPLPEATPGGAFPFAGGPGPWATSPFPMPSMEGVGVEAGVVSAVLSGNTVTPPVLHSRRGAEIWLKFPEGVNPWVTVNFTDYPPEEVKEYYPKGNVRIIKTSIPTMEPRRYYVAAWTLDGDRRRQLHPIAHEGELGTDPFLDAKYVDLSPGQVTKVMFQEPPPPTEDPVVAAINNFSGAVAGELQGLHGEISGLRADIKENSDNLIAALKTEKSKTEKKRPAAPSAKVTQRFEFVQTKLTVTLISQGAKVLQAEAAVKAAEVKSAEEANVLTTKILDEKKAASTVADRKIDLAKALTDKDAAVKKLEATPGDADLKAKAEEAAKKANATAVVLATAEDAEAKAKVDVRKADEAVEKAKVKEKESKMALDAARASAISMQVAEIAPDKKLRIEAKSAPDLFKLLAEATKQSLAADLVLVVVDPADRFTADSPLTPSTSVVAPVEFTYDGKETLDASISTNSELTAAIYHAVHADGSRKNRMLIRGYLRFSLENGNTIISGPLGNQIELTIK